MGITNNIILRSYLELLNVQNLSEDSSGELELLFCLLERIPDICATNDKSVIQCEFEVRTLKSDWTVIISMVINRSYNCGV